MVKQQLNGKTAVITGGGQGIGLGISQSFLSAGASLLIAQRSPLPDELEIRSKVQWVEADLSHPDSYEKITKAAEKKFGAVDILVNNAGIMFEKPLDSMLISEWQHMIAINLTAPVFLAKSLLPLLRESKGNIINIGSIEGIDANPQHIAYCATKGGVHAMTKAMAVDLGKDKIRCNAIAPGWIRSALSDDYINAQENRRGGYSG